MDITARPLRVMLDTTVLVSGSGRPRWPHEVLLAALNGAFELVLCPYLLEEVRRVAALNAGVDYLVSEDKDLSAGRVIKDARGRHLSVLLSGTFLREMLGWSSDDLERVRGRTWSDMRQKL